MKAPYKARKRVVKLTLNEEPVVQSHGLTDNLSGVVESLLAVHVKHECQQRIATTRTIEVTIATWNDFNSKQGSFADEYSPL